MHCSSMNTFPAMLNYMQCLHLHLKGLRYHQLRCEITKCGLLQNNQIDILKDLAMILRGQIFQHSVCLIFGVAIML